MNMPEAHTRQDKRQECKRPKRSFKSRANKAPNAAPRTLKEVMLALRLVNPVGSSVQLEEIRLKSD